MNTAEKIIIECQLNQLAFFKKEYKSLISQAKALREKLQNCRAISSKRLNRVEKLEQIIKAKDKK